MNTPDIRQVLGVVGHPIRHSDSPALFAARFERLGRTDLTYDAFDIATAEEVNAWMRSTPNLRGFNVTLPHKQRLVPYLDGLDAEARAVGAVNTVVRTDEGWVGHNTDVHGFRTAVKPFLTMHHERALVLGSGGAAAAVHFVLKGLGMEAVTVSRSVNAKSVADEGRPERWARPVIGYDELSEPLLQHHLLVVNCSPVGMHPDTAGCPPIPVHCLTPRHLVVDLVYKPRETALMRRARSQGAAALNGEDMLRLQADRAWEIWSAAGV